ncbi:MAG: APC family permease [Ktedonobacterales bacterium]
MDKRTSDDAGELPSNSQGGGSETRPAQAAANRGPRDVLKGGKLGNSYVRIRAPIHPVQTLRWGDGGVLTSEEQGTETPTPRQTPPLRQTEPTERATGTASSAAPTGQRREDVVLPGLGQRVVPPGARPYGGYIRRALSREFRQRGENVIEATERALAPQSPAGRAYQRAKRVLIGSRLATEQQIHERLTKVKALAVLSSDAISSVAYATEASLGVLILAGSGALTINPFIAVAIVALMLTVGTSYFQTIHAYPSGGGSYLVARDNLGDLPGLIAAAALLIDYILTVSVSVSSGIDAIVSVVTPLAPYDVLLGVLCILLILLINLRGIRESGTIFAAPTYIFVGSFLFMVLAGIFYAATHGGGLLGAVPPAATPLQRGWGDVHEQLGLVLVLTAFSAGCVAMTGTEAISNGIPAFKPPESRNAGRTLVWMVAILASLYVGTTYLAWRFGLVPYATQQPTLDAQIANLIFLKGYSALGFMYYVVQVATLIILVLAANTSFADFPRLSSILARDGFLPHQFAFRGDRLAFTVGIVVLGALSSVLLVIFKGSTDALINLYALGVFTAFTLSQTGMVVHWWRLRERAGAQWRRSLIINGTGAIITGIVAVIIIATKFDRGAWIVVILVPVLVLMFRGIARHYTAVHKQTEALTPLRPEELRHIMLVPVAELNRPALQSLAYARSLTPHVIALHVSLDTEEEATFRQAWEKFVTKREATLAAVAEGTAPRTSGATGTLLREHALALLEKQPQLVVIESPYRALVLPLKAYIDALRDANPGATVTVVLPEFVPAHRWERILHNQMALRLKLALYSDPGVAVVSVPYHLRRQLRVE